MSAYTTDNEKEFLDGLGHQARREKPMSRLQLLRLYLVSLGKRQRWDDISKRDCERHALMLIERETVNPFVLAQFEPGEA